MSLSLQCFSTCLLLVLIYSQASLQLLQSSDFDSVAMIGFSGSLQLGQKPGILLMTSDLMFYTFDNTALDETKGQLLLNKSIRQWTWPFKFGGYYGQQMAGRQMLHGATIGLEWSNSSVIYMDFSPGHDKQLSSLLYIYFYDAFTDDLDSSLKRLPGPNEYWISSVNQSIMIVLTKSQVSSADGVHLVMSTYWVNNATLSRYSNKYHMSYLNVIDGSSYLLCDGGHQSIYFSDKACPNNSPDWNVTRGLATETYFYLFASNLVFIFPTKAYTEQWSNKSKYYVRSFIDFFHNANFNPTTAVTIEETETNATTVPTTTLAQGSSLMGMFIVAVVFVLIIVFMLLAFCAYMWNKKSNDEKENIGQATMVLPSDPNVVGNNYFELAEKYRPKIEDKGKLPAAADDWFGYNNQKNNKSIKPKGISEKVKSRKVGPKSNTKANDKAKSIKPKKVDDKAKSKKSNKSGAKSVASKSKYPSGPSGLEPSGPIMSGSHRSKTSKATKPKGTSVKNKKQEEPNKSKKSKNSKKAKATSVKGKKAAPDQTAKSEVGADLPSLMSGIQSGAIEKSVGKSAKSNKKATIKKVPSKPVQQAKQAPPKSVKKTSIKKEQAKQPTAPVKSIKKEQVKQQAAPIKSIKKEQPKQQAAPVKSIKKTITKEVPPKTAVQPAKQAQPVQQAKVANPPAKGVALSKDPIAKNMVKAKVATAANLPVKSEVGSKESVQTRPREMMEDLEPMDL